MSVGQRKAQAPLGDTAGSIPDQPNKENTAAK